jgi:hypothetical protein
MTASLEMIRHQDSAKAPRREKNDLTFGEMGSKGFGNGDLRKSGQWAAEEVCLFHSFGDVGSDMSKLCLGRHQRATDFDFPRIEEGLNG